MKRSLLIIGVLLTMLMVGNGCREDHERENKSEKKREFKNMRGRGPGQMGQMMGRPGMRGNRGFMPQGPNAGMRGNNMGMPMCGMRRGMAPMGFDRPGIGPMGPGRFLERLPNITDKQKKEIADLRQKQMDEMKKFQEETATKIKSMREANKAKMMNLLTDEQKKFLESRTGIAPTPPTASEKKK